MKLSKIFCARKYFDRKNMNKLISRFLIQKQPYDKHEDMNIFMKKQL